MKNRQIKLTTARFAQLHGLNKRTLHYYDDIGLFSPQYKGNNGYRYYDLSQSADLENIRMLKELNMSIEEIRGYRQHPNPDSFIHLADTKLAEIDEAIQKLELARNVLKQKKKQLVLSERISDGEIDIQERKTDYILTTDYDFKEYDMEKILAHLTQAWDIEQYRAGCGSYISAEKITAGEFEEYDGIFTQVQKIQKKNRSRYLVPRPGGLYLCGYVKGSWDKIPAFYRKLLKYAENNHLKLTGYAYEMGLNEYAISSMEEYVTQIIVPVEKL